jgi:hypothetical protein
MKQSLALAAVLLCGLLTACGTVMPAPQEKFLTNTFESTPNDAPALNARRSTVTVDPARAQVGEIAWLAGTGADLTDKERGQLVELLRAQLRASVQTLPAAPGGRPVVLRAAITRVETVSPALNTVSTLLLLAPWDRGGAVTEIEAVDAESGKQIAAIRTGYFAPLSDIKARFIRLAPAEIAIRKAVTDFNQLVMPIPTATQIARP